MVNRINPGGVLSISSLWSILGILILVSTLGGCVGLGSKQDSPAASEDNLTLAQSATVPTDGSNPNQLRLLLSSKQFNKTGKLPVMLQIMNPRLNETVLTVFKPQYGQEWYNQTSITRIVNNSWSQNFTIKPKSSNISYVLMFVQISKNDTVVKKAAWNITLGVPVGRPK